MNNLFQSIQEKGFTTFIYISYFLILMTALGFSQLAPKYLYDMDYYVKIYVCLFLIFRFNPFRNRVEFTELDRKIAFSAGLFVLTTTFIAKYVTKLSVKSRNFLIETVKDNVSGVF